MEFQKRRFYHAHARVHAQRLRVPSVVETESGEQCDAVGELQQGRLHTDSQIVG